MAYDKSDSLPIVKWKLRQYESPTGRRAVDDWRAAMPPGPFKSDLDTLLKLMVKTRVWVYPQLKGLQGQQKGLTELRWTSGKIQHRLIGYEMAGHQYVMLVGCTHKGTVYTPAGALDSAVDRKKSIEAGTASTCEYKLFLG